MNKLQWKQYLNTITNTFDTIPLPFPSLNNRNTYCFQIKRIYSSLNIYPKIGLPNNTKYNFLFEEYRITAIKINVTNGQIRYDDNTSIIKAGSFSITYWPNFPKLEKQFIIPGVDKKWIITGDNIEIAINYEIIPLIPFLTIPSNNLYTNLEEFNTEYNSIQKQLINSTIQIKNDILTIDENINVLDFLKNINGSY